jgi:hypothetical protein
MLLFAPKHFLKKITICVFGRDISAIDGACTNSDLNKTWVSFLCNCKKGFLLVLLFLTREVSWNYITEVDSKDSRGSLEDFSEVFAAFIDQIQQVF